MEKFTNSGYRALNNVDTLCVSKSLSRLKDLGFIKQKGGGAYTYYEQADVLFKFSSIETTAPDEEAGGVEAIL